MNVGTARYELLVRLGAGGQGEVYRALDHTTGRHVAVKVGATASDCALTGMAPHPSIPRALDTFTDGAGRTCLVMEWVDGVALDAVLRDRGPLRLSGVLHHLGPVAQALEHLHAHEIVHGDVKPSNILLTSERHAFLVDFGAGVTPGFSAPEVLAGFPATAASDAYSLAATAYTLLTGSPPSAGGVAVDALTDALAIDPSRRPPPQWIIEALRPSRIPVDMPTGRGSFVGRHRELEALEDLLAERRLVTLRGPGGSGKTRLAAELARRLLADHPGGTWTCELASLREPALVVQALAFAIGVPVVPGRTPRDAVDAFLHSRVALVVLDNCEHLLGACADIAESLARAHPGLRVVATSREALGAPSEHTFDVAPFAVPVASGELTAQAVEGYDAVRLFRDRAGVVLDERTAPAVARLVARLDGIPLAIELAAARASGTDVDDLAGSLPPDVEAPLDATIRWSYDLLTPDERALFRRLATFAAGCTRDAAEEVCDADAATLEALCRRSLLVREQRSSHVRYRMLETVRAFAERELELHGGSRVLRLRLLASLVHLAESAALQGPDGPRWLDLLVAETDNIRAALRWSVESGRAADAVRLSSALVVFWHHAGLVAEGREWVERSLAQVPEGSAVRGDGIYTAGYLAARLGDFPAAEAYASAALDNASGERRRMAALMLRAEVAVARGRAGAALEAGREALGVARDCGFERNLPAILHTLGQVELMRGDLAAARRLVEDAVESARAFGDRQELAGQLGTLAHIALEQGDLDAAGTLFAEQLSTLEGLRGGRQEALAVAGLGVVALQRGDARDAIRLLEDAAALARALGDVQLGAFLLCNLTVAARRAGDGDRATAWAAEATTLAPRVGNTRLVAGVLEAVASVVGDHEASARLLGAADALWTSITSELPILFRDDHERRIAQARKALGARAVAAAWAKGKTMAQDEALALARRALDDRSQVR
jgi:non-specific serine/threonine protein kinase